MHFQETGSRWWSCLLYTSEQDADQWWEAMCSTTKEIMSETDVTPDMIDGISFCSQMQGMVLVDREGRALRRPMSYMDQRAVREMKECQSHGIRIAGVNVFKLLKSQIGRAHV